MAKDDGESPNVGAVTKSSGYIFECEVCGKTSHEPFENMFGDSTVCSDACYMVRVNKGGFCNIFWVDTR
ncbi:MAG: hypothetical protein WCH58_03920 [Candidatus Saccharibacteria bacterium]